ncbi:hypothetical protein Pmar_PMAR011134 [Perkinsus marinus ATCC 50983]|uniref:Uncharacterized protein n=1 Tax=Perkinsus marinus (strain ATCC 50983 / TXsc) TaxID=423536 RepID=C5KVT2_PERM5|nr:hypothetical protein Pmar_PMAR011134 [Perkinsus marinus ATCC 50983]EER11467.1 hypothetical protein Pmar_PMAR011134 [Perkinsus marinus ATCC 50983]|eukprot:XP_002779672.1 hypothetical protein Pmar_PMAR011134 [Perkinsus marinus ATCC 50983]
MFFILSIAAFLTSIAAGLVMVLSVVIPIVAIGVLRNVAGNLHEIFLSNTFDLNDLLAKLGLLIERVPSRVTIDRFSQKPLVRVMQ